MIIYGYIYLVRNKTNNKIYIGQTINGFDKRYSNNIAINTSNKHLKRSIEKYGIDNFEIDKEFDVAYSKEELDNLEDMYIKIYNATDENFGYNKRFGGANGSPTKETREKLRQANLGKTHSEESKKKQSLAMSGIKNPMYGKNAYEGKTDEEMIAIHIKRSASVSGEKHPMYGRKHKDSSILKMRIASKKGNSKSREIINVTTNEIFEYTVQGAEEYNIDSSSLNKCLKGKISFCGKLVDETPMIWMYMEDYLKSTKEDIIKKIIKANNSIKTREVLCITTNKKFNSIKEACEYYCINSVGNVTKCCTGIRKSAGKLNNTPLTWSYVVKQVNKAE